MEDRNLLSLIILALDVYTLAGTTEELKINPKKLKCFTHLQTIKISSIL